MTILLANGLGKQIVRCKQVELIEGDYLGRHIFHYVGRHCIKIAYLWFWFGLLIVFCIRAWR